RRIAAYPAHDHWRRLDCSVGRVAWRLSQNYVQRQVARMDFRRSFRTFWADSGARDSKFRLRRGLDLWCPRTADFSSIFEVLRRAPCPAPPRGSELLGMSPNSPH